MSINYIIQDNTSQENLIMFNCPHCQKEYKTQGWLNKHITEKHTIVSAPQPEPVIEEPIIIPALAPAPAPAPALAPVYKEVKDMTPQEIEAHKALLASNGKTTINNGIVENTIYTELYNGNTFYFTKVKKDNCKLLNITYVSPQDKALSSMGDNVPICKEKVGFMGSVNKAYGSLPYSVLNQIWQTDNHLYEILKTERKPYFDIEFRFVSNEHTITQFNLITKAIIEAFNKINVEVKTEHFAVCFNLGIAKKGIFAGLKKVSYHLIINNGYKFKSIDDANIFCGKYIPQIIQDSQEYNVLYHNEGLAIDTGVYTLNRCFKLPYQSKANDKRPQIPEPRFNRNELSDFIISQNIENYTHINIDGIQLKETEHIRKVRQVMENHSLHGQSWNFNAIDEFLSNMGETNYKQDIPGDVSLSIPYLVKSIYNGKEIGFKVWFYIGSAIKRCVSNFDEAVKLFTQWTQKYNKNETEGNIRLKMETFGSDSCGFKTLLSLASLCNDKLKSYVATPWISLFNIDTLPENTKKYSVNKRYIDYNDFLQDDIHRHTLTKSTYYIKSPMGTGKTHSFREYFNKAKTEFEPYTNFRVIYLSSKRAFAESVAQEFADIVFINYMRTPNLCNENFIIISLESLKRLSKSQLEENTLLFIDESESIFNIVSSETLAKNDLLANLNAFNTLIQSSSKVFVMDAFLSNRSIEAVNSIRDNSNIFYYENTFKYPERYYYELKADPLIENIVGSIEANKRCVLVSGSYQYGLDVVKYCQQKKPQLNYGFYNQKNPLALSTKVNEAWRDFDLLAYSPSITCGISYDNPQALYDNLFIYAVSVGSTHFRDIIQAHKRVRAFTDKKIGVCLNTQFKGLHREMMPIYKDEVVNLLSTTREQLFFNEEVAPSIKAQTNLQWVLNIHAYNTIEKNIHSLYLREVAKCFFDMENIKQAQPTDIHTTHIQIVNSLPDDWKASKINNIDYYEYVRIYNMLNDNSPDSIKPTPEEYQQYLKYIFKHRTGEKYTDDLFNEWYKEGRRDYIENIKAFKECLFKTFTEWERAQDTNRVIEFLNMRCRAYKMIIEILTDLDVISDNKLDLSKRFTTDKFDNVVEKLKNMDKKALNQLFIKGYYRDTDDKGNKIQLTTKTAHSILNMLLSDWFGYGISKEGEKIRVIDGNRRKISVYKIESTQTILNRCLGTTPNIDHCLFTAFSDEWTKIKTDNAYDLS